MDKEYELYYWEQEDGKLVPVHELTDYHICNIVMKFGKNWLINHGHSIIADRYVELNNKHDFFKVVKL